MLPIVKHLKRMLYSNCLVAVWEWMLCISKMGSKACSRTFLFWKAQHCAKQRWFLISQHILSNQRPPKTQELVHYNHIQLALTWSAHPLCESEHFCGPSILGRWSALLAKILVPLPQCHSSHFINVSGFLIQWLNTMKESPWIFSGWKDVYI